MQGDYKMPDWFQSEEPPSNVQELGKDQGLVLPKGSSPSFPLEFAIVAALKRFHLCSPS